LQHGFILFNANDETVPVTKDWTHFDGGGVIKADGELFIEDYHGWVRSKYLKSIKCPKNKDQEELIPPDPPEPQVTDEFRDDWCRRNNWDGDRRNAGQSPTCQDKKPWPKWLLGR
jgi:hypothetical protein